MTFNARFGDTALLGGNIEMKSSVALMHITRIIRNIHPEARVTKRGESDSLCICSDALSEEKNREMTEYVWDRLCEDTECVTDWHVIEDSCMWKIK